MSLMTPLINAPYIIPQLILTLCSVSIATINQIAEVMNPFNGDTIRPRINGRTNNYTTSYLVDTGAAACCMSKKTFDMLFKNKLPKRLPDNMMFRSASGTRLNVFGTFEIPLNIRGKTITHPFRVMENLSDNIIGIDFMHKHGLYYDPRKRIISFDDGVPNSLTCTKDYTIEALTSQLITVHYHGMKIEDNLAIATHILLGKINIIR